MQWRGVTVARQIFALCGGRRTSIGRIWCPAVYWLALVFGVGVLCSDFSFFISGLHFVGGGRRGVTVHKM